MARRFILMLETVSAEAAVVLDALASSAIFASFTIISSFEDRSPENRMRFVLRFPEKIDIEDLRTYLVGVVGDVCNLT